HSVVLDVAATGGIVGLVAWGAVMAFVARALWRSARGSAWTTGLAVGLAAHWVGQLFLFPVVEIEPWAWLLAGYLIGRSGREVPGREVPGTSRPSAYALVGLAA